MKCAGAIYKRKNTTIQFFNHKKFILRENCIFIFGQGLNLCVDNQIMLKGL